jgi:hypothetical protein
VRDGSPVLRVRTNQNSAANRRTPRTDVTPGANAEEENPGVRHVRVHSIKDSVHMRGERTDDAAEGGRCPVITSEVSGARCPARSRKAGSSSSSSCLGDRLVDGIAALLLRQHDLETVEVGEAAARGDRGALLRPRGLFPLGECARLLERGLDRGRASGARQLWDDERGEGEVAEGEGLARDAC